MVVRNSLLTAMCVAGLLGVASVGTANAAATLVPTQLVYTVSPGAVVNVNGTATFTGGGMFTAGIFSTLVDPALTELSLTNLVGGTSPYSGLLASYQAPLATGSYDATLNFDSDGGPASATITIDVVNVPEPGVIAFGVIAAGSVLGLVARKRKS